jgi:hypothetical protein
MPFCLEKRHGKVRETARPLFRAIPPWSRFSGWKRQKRLQLCLDILLLSDYSTYTVSREGKNNFCVWKKVFSIN